MECQAWQRRPPHIAPSRDTTSSWRSSTSTRSPPLRLLTETNVPEILQHCAADDEVSLQDRAFLEPIWPQKQSNAALVINLDYGLRFQAKLALGFGYALFGQAFAQLPYEVTLRSILRERDPARRAQLPFISPSIFQSVPADTDIDRLAYEGAFTFLFNGSRAGVFLTIFTPSRRRLDVQIAPTPVVLPSELLAQHVGSFAVLIIPGLTQSLGPLPIGHYALHRFGAHSHPDLAQLDARRIPLADFEKLVARYDIHQ